MNNPEVGELILLSPSSVSRLRSGFREPTLTTMRRCEDLFDWPIADQDQAVRDKMWHSYFETVLARYEEQHAAVETIPE